MINNHSSIIQSNSRIFNSVLSLFLALLSPHLLGLSLLISLKKNTLVCGSLLNENPTQKMKILLEIMIHEVIMLMTAIEIVPLIKTCSLPTPRPLPTPNEYSNLFYFCNFFPLRFPPNKSLFPIETQTNFDVRHQPKKFQILITRRIIQHD